MFDIDFLGFPRRAHHILLPVRPIQAARAGLALYDNTRLHQRLTRTAGMTLLNLRVLQRLYHLGPMPPSLLDQQWWIRWCEQVARPIVGRARHAAFRFYENRVAALLMNESSQPIGFVKVWRSPPGPPHPTPYMQPEILRRLADRTVPFRVAALLAEGTLDGWSYELFEPLPRGRHLPVEAEPTRIARIFDAMHERLADLTRHPDVPYHHVLGHGDFSSRNVRRASDGNIWVVDWEYACWSPRLADELFFWSSEFSHRVRQRPNHYGCRVLALLRQRGDDEDIADALRWEAIMTSRQRTIAGAVAHAIGFEDVNAGYTRTQRTRQGCA